MAAYQFFVSCQTVHAILSAFLSVSRRRALTDGGQRFGLDVKDAAKAHGRPPIHGAGLFALEAYRVSIQIAL